MPHSLQCRPALHRAGAAGAWALFWWPPTRNGDGKKRSLTYLYPSMLCAHVWTPQSQHAPMTGACATANTDVEFQFDFAKCRWLLLIRGPNLVGYRSGQATFLCFPVFSTFVCVEPYVGLAKVVPAVLFHGALVFWTESAVPIHFHATRNSYTQGSSSPVKYTLLAVADIWHVASTISGLT